MPLLQGLFRSKPKSKDAQTPRARAWPNLRRWNSVITPLGRTERGSTLMREEVEATTTEETEVVVPQSVVPKAPVVVPVEKGHSQHGSKRLKGIIMSRLHLSRSEARSQSSMSELELPPPLLKIKSPPVAAKVKLPPPMVKMPTVYRSPLNSNGSLPSIPINDDPSGPSGSGTRNVSTQTMMSQVSATTDSTIRRHPSLHAPMPIQELDESDFLWSNLVNFNLDRVSAGHANESSDPFSDDKEVAVEPQSVAAQYASNLYESQPDHDQGPPVTPTNVSKSHNHQNSRKRRQISAGGSDTSRCSQMCRLNPKKAVVAFNMLASQLNVPITIPPNDPTTVTAANTMIEGNNQPTYRGLFNLIRPVQSSMALGDSFQPLPEKATNKLRRSKTFSNIGRRARPMSSLRGRSLENIARLGGHSYLILPNDLAPAPLQLPVCIVAPVLYLRQSGTFSAELFINPGNMKAAVRLYDHFASQVLSVQNDEKIAMTMRVVGMPHWETGSPSTTPVLSVGLVFKELLAGLPDGILGSLPLYHALQGVNRAAPENPARARLITLAIVAFTSEMQCALICAVFGFLSGLVSKAEHSAEAQDAGTSDRVVATLDSAGLVRTFGPLLVGVQQSDPQRQVEQEVEDSRVMKMLLGDWREVNRQMRNWTSGYSRRIHV
ncbi:Rho GTPase activation protein [Penicillium taxi]|uniref:Rho GTPase activation protein n=1 Tax=Penicillium taxi TaxID=168475 RepID=UPI002544DA58|nr:Rho GTPase activation protein [Penicillium taxi]KAJ5909127.1 Rho GTPase activation protein [Penicillium taxi]